MTPNKVIVHVDSVKPNSYGDEDKLAWINELDGMVRKLVFQDATVSSYSYPEDMDTELLIPAPFELIYALYVRAMIDFHNGEIGSYNNAIQMFYARFEDYKKAYIRENRPSSSGNFKM